MSATAISPSTYGSDPALYRFSVSQYQRMIESGIVTAGDDWELLENWVVICLPRTADEESLTERVAATISGVAAEWMSRVRPPLVCPDSHSKPDCVLLRAGPDRPPTVTDTALVIEVADSSLLRDQRDKTRIYARAGIPVYWIINLVDRRVEVYTQPSGPVAVPAYGAFQTFQPGDIVPLVLDGTTVTSVPVADLLP